MVLVLALLAGQTTRRLYSARPSTSMAAGVHEPAAVDACAQRAAMLLVMRAASGMGLATEALDLTMRWRWADRGARIYIIRPMLGVLAAQLGTAGHGVDLAGVRVSPHRLVRAVQSGSTTSTCCPASHFSLVLLKALWSSRFRAGVQPDRAPSGSA